MKLPEAMGIINDYEEDFSAIGEIINDPDLTPSEKVAEIAEIVQEEEDES